jgi:archaemetzincin
MQSFVTADSWRVLGIAAVDLYIPILTFVFGEAQMGGPCAVVSVHRLRQEFYGLPADQELFRQRALKEAVHEIGHTVNLTHCSDYQCAMAPSHAVEWIDLKESTLCAGCQAVATPGAQVPSARGF